MYFRPPHWSSHAYLRPQVRRPKTAFNIVTIKCVDLLRIHAKQLCWRTNNAKTSEKTTKHIHPSWNERMTLNRITTFDISMVNVSTYLIIVIFVMQSRINHYHTPRITTWVNGIMNWFYRSYASEKFCIFAVISIRRKGERRKNHI